MLKGTEILALRALCGLIGVGAMVNAVRVTETGDICGFITFGVLGMCALAGAITPGAAAPKS